MLQLLSYLAFIISVAFAAGGIVLSSRLHSRYRSEAFSALLYFQAFVYAFGFYGIWGQVLIRSFLAPYIAEGLPEKITAFSVVMGLPFLVFAWLMLVQFSVLISGRKKSSWFILTFLLFNFAVIFIAGYFVTRSGETDTLSLVRYYFILMNSLCLVVAAGLTASPVKGKSMIQDREIKIIAPLLILIMLMQSGPLIFYSGQLWLALIFIFLFHAGYAFLPLWFTYGTLLPEPYGEPANDLSFEGFIRKFEISPRETDIIREICNGLSNKEISDKLFISLQTVKDHTHRIYIKTNVRSRVQLINLVRELRES